MARLRKVLAERIAEAARAGLLEAAEARVVVEDLLLRYKASGMLDDQRFAKRFVEQQRERGASRRVIEQKLRQRGIPSELVQELCSAGESRASELAAASAFAKRRRLGPHRKPETREAFRRKDLMAMARAGFNYETASRALASAATEGEDF